jgi:hypothetical protein
VSPRSRTAASAQTRLRRAYAGYSMTHLADNGVPARFTVHAVDVPHTAAAYEFYGTALLQRSLQGQGQGHG